MVGVVVASKGYPEAYTKGVLLPSFESEEGVHIYYSGVSQNAEGELFSDGGRVYLAASQGDSLQEAQSRVYAFLEQYSDPNMFYRTDIAHRALPRGH